MNVTNPIERLREIWTPNKELSEMSADLAPQTILDSQIRDLLCRIILQKGPVTLNLDLPNAGTLRWEEIVHEPMPGIRGRREISIWIE